MEGASSHYSPGCILSIRILTPWHRTPREWFINISSSLPTCNIHQISHFLTTLAVRLVFGTLNFITFAHSGFLRTAYVTFASFKVTTLSISRSHPQLCPFSLHFECITSSFESRTLHKTTYKAQD
ncbi:hypothetical protein PILCRDRAFT_384563 [Piloderma croceum F 1598]|uniref:Uncharacterized protein n=1 Tax=Piloderma croceum (strain F 1598) TaxID=765440 RepID=A0A0C3BDS8_PILCF|nr:hypothetical protein PILCRDRAFT_384563 [Piloderma croceum F 1598]